MNAHLIVADRLAAAGRPSVEILMPQRHASFPCLRLAARPCATRHPLTRARAARSLIMGSKSELQHPIGVVEQHVIQDLVLEAQSQEIV